jgi:hypothetical protein
VAPNGWKAPSIYRNKAVLASGGRPLKAVPTEILLRGRAYSEAPEPKRRTLWNFDVEHGIQGFTLAEIPVFTRFSECYKIKIGPPTLALHVIAQPALPSFRNVRGSSSPSGPQIGNTRINVVFVGVFLGILVGTIVGY